MRFRQPHASTLRDIARLANVSVGTVSRALRGSPLVKPTTRERVVRLARELHYTPDVHARRLSTGRALTIAVVVPFFTRPSAVERLSGVVSTLAPTEYDLLIHDIETPERRANCFTALPRQVDGLLVISVTPTDEEAEALLEANVPFVLVDADHARLAGVPRVTVDDVAGGEMATHHLLDLGHERIGFIGDYAKNPFGFRSSRDRFVGFKRALERAGLTFNPAHYAEGEHGRLPAKRSAEGLLQRADRPTAFFAASDTQAIGVMEAARECGLRVPEDVSVIGYDDIELAEILGLTTVNQSLTRSGRLGVDLLLKLVAGSPPEEPTRHVLPCRLVQRRSTAPPP